jgi:hypothetical protein
MNFRDRIKREWHVIEGHAKWDFYKWVFGLFLVAGAAVLTLGTYLVHRMWRYGPDWLPYAVGFVLALILFFWMGKKLTVSSSNPTVAQSAKPAQKTTLSPHDPDLRADIQEVLFHLKRLRISNDVFVVLRVSVVNHGESEAVVTQWNLTVEVGDERIECEEEKIPADWRIRRINPASRVEDFNRDASTFREPLRRGVPKERWVCFRVTSLIMRLLPPHNAKLILTLTDAFGRTHVTEGGPGFADETGELVEHCELPPAPSALSRSTVLTESVIETIEKVGKLRSLAGRADFLRDHLEEVWHVFLKEKKDMPNPIGIRSIPDKNIEEWTHIQLWRFRVRYQDYLGSMKAADPDCESDLVKDGFPHEGEDYLSVERKIKEHAAALKKRADDLLAQAKDEHAKAQN